MNGALAGVLAAAAVWLAGRAIAAGRSGMLPPDGAAGAGHRAREPGVRPRRVVAERLRPARRADLLAEQLTEALAAIASGSRAGLSLLQAIEAAAEQSPDPLGADLRELAERVRLGAPLEEALERWALAEPAPEVRLSVGVLRMHRAVGGSVAPALENLARALRERRTARRELRSLTAQARLSGAILGLLPIGFFSFLWVTSRADMLVALGTPLGRSAVVVGLLLDGAAFAWIRRLLRVEA